MYGYLLATDYACLGLASAVLLPCLIRFCRLTDFSLAIIGVIFKIFRLAMISYGQYKAVQSYEQYNTLSTVDNILRSVQLAGLPVRRRRMSECPHHFQLQVSHQ